MKKILLLCTTLIFSSFLSACGISKSVKETVEETIAEETTEAIPEFTFEEVAAIEALNAYLPYLEENLIDPSSLKINSISVVTDPENDRAHHVRIDYNANNRMGGSNRHKVYLLVQGVSVKTDSFAEAMGGDPYKNGSAGLFGYDGERLKLEIVDIDVDKVMDNLEIDTYEVMEKLGWK